MYAENLKKVRNELHLSVEKMSEKLGIPARTLGGWERGERTCSIELLTQLCNKLNVNANWFVTGKGQMFNSKIGAAQYEDVKASVLEEVRMMLRDEGIIK